MDTVRKRRFLERRRSSMAKNQRRIHLIGGSRIS